MTRFFTLALFCCVSASAQWVVGAKAGLIDHLEGAAYLDGAPVRVTPGNFPGIKEGQRLTTGNGKAEMLLNPDIFLRLGENASLAMENSPLTDAQVKIEHGSALVEVVEFVKGNRVRVLFGDTVTEFLKQGVYRFDADQGKLRILGGEAAVTAGGRTVKATRGSQLDLLHGLKSVKFDLKVQDSFHQWAGIRSANLFSANPWARRTQVRWVILGVLPTNNARGVIWNPDYGMRVPSPQALYDFIAKQSLEATEKRRAQAALDYLRRQDDQRVQQEIQKNGGSPLPDTPSWNIPSASGPVTSPRPIQGAP